LDAARLRDSFAAVAAHGDEVPLFFYSDLFLKHPQVRDLFPVSMTAQRAHLAAALAKIAAGAGDPAQLTAFLRDLGRDHRKFGALAEHYDAVGASLLATLEHFAGPGWTPELAADWAEAYQLAASVMTAAAADDEQRRPACWQATVTAFERRGPEIAVLTVRPDPALDYQPGQSVAVETPARPRLWRYYSMASPPRPDGLLEFHVRLIDGGAVSMALTAGAITGTTLRLGPPVGSLTYTPGTGRGLLLIAGSTGLAPLKAILGQVAALPDPPRTDLLFAARTAEGLYDLDHLDKLAAASPWLTITPAVTCGPPPASHPHARHGPLPALVTAHASPPRDAYLAGPADMVTAAAAALTTAGLPPDHIHTENFGWSEP